MEIAARSVKLQDELHCARKQISSLERSSKGKDVAVGLEFGGSPLIIDSVSIMPSLTESCSSSAQEGMQHVPDASAMESLDKITESVDIVSLIWSMVQLA